MSLENEDRKKWLDLFYNPGLTEYQFIGLLLPYMGKCGIRTTTEEELSKKLYPYFIDENYRDVFMEVEKDRYRKQVNIAAGMFDAKSPLGCVRWTSNNPDKLYLSYGNNYDTSSYEKDIDIAIVNLIKNIATELGIRNKFETSNLNIYGYDPNESYSIISAKTNYSQIVESKIITDGDILGIKDHDFEPHIFYPDPIGSSEARQYKEGIYRDVSLKNASYAIIQGTFNDELKKSEVFTKITEADKLEKICEIAKQSQIGNGILLTEGKPYVKKISLF